MPRRSRCSSPPSPGEGAALPGPAHPAIHGRGQDSLLHFLADMSAKGQRAMPNASRLIREAAAACRASPYLEIPRDRRAEAEVLLECAAGRPIVSDALVEGCGAREVPPSDGGEGGRGAARVPNRASDGSRYEIAGRPGRVHPPGLERLPRGRGHRTGKRTADADRGRCAEAWGRWRCCVPRDRRTPPCTDWTSRRRPSRLPGGTLAPLASPSSGSSGATCSIPSPARCGDGSMSCRPIHHMWPAGRCVTYATE
jgi:hypothetical protein